MSQKGIKVVTIGGGSSYTPELIEGFIIRYHTLPVREIVLVDIEEGREKLEIVGTLAQRMVKKSGLPIKILLTTERKSALRDADFVITQIRVGGSEGRIKDVRISLSHGVIGQETNGAGGLFMGLRTIPVILEIASEMQELCPDAWLVNFSNPAGMVTEALLRYGTHPKVVGLCNVPTTIHKLLSQILDVESQRVRIDFAGLNHMVFGLRTYLDGCDISEHALNLTIEHSDRMTMNNIHPITWEPDFIRGLGVIPCPYHRYYYKTTDVLEELSAEYQRGETRPEVVQRLETELFQQYRDPDLNEKPDILAQRGGAFYSDAACQLIASIYTDAQDIQTVNVRNNGAIRGLPVDSAVEVSSLITKEGPKPLSVGELPIAVMGLVQQIKSFEQLGAEAAVTGDYHTGLLALTINPLISSDTVAKRLFDEMLDAHRAFLPQFANKAGA